VSPPLHPPSLSYPVPLTRALSSAAKFGFFDLDALFSAAFVFVLAEKISPRTPTDPCGIRDAASLMGWLSASGNKAATKRLADIHQMCSHLGIAVDWQGPAITPTSAAQDVPRENAVPGVRLGGGGEVVSAWQPEHAGREAEFGMLSFSPNELDLEAFWNGNDLSLDGTIETDWQEFERITSQF
jgi:proline utilization trans-activator